MTFKIPILIKIMLVLGRKKNESIIINDEIEVVVLKVDKNQVKLGIKAPKEIPVHRKEIFLKIKKMQQEGQG